MKASDLFIKALEAEGAEYIFGIPGEENLDFLKWKQTHMGFADFGLDAGNADFVRYAESYGAHGHRLSAAAELIPLLHECFAAQGVRVIEAPIDYSDNDRILNHEIKDNRSRLL